MSDENADAALMKICRRAHDAAERCGAAEVEVYAESGRSVSTNIEQNEIKGAMSAEYAGIGIRVKAGRGIGFAYVNRTDEGALADAANDACTIARHADDDTPCGLAPAATLPEIAGLYDDGTAQLDVVDTTRLAHALRGAAVDHEPRVRGDGAVTASVMRAAVKNSLGHEAQTTETFVSYGLYGMAKDGDNIGALDESYRGHCAATEIDAVGAGAEFREKVLRHLNPVAAPTYKGAVVLSHDAFSDIFLAALTEALDGELVLKKKSRFCDHDGSPIASAGLTVVDDGTRPSGPGSSRFDREGRGHSRFHLVRAGELGGFLYDGRTAARAGAASTGHAAGSARGAPYIGTTNLIVETGPHTEAQLLARAGRSLFVGRLAGTVDGVSGDFSGVAKNSFLIEDGVRTRPVSETLIAGNVFDLLHRIDALGDTHRGEFGLFSPWVLVDGVSVTGGAA